MNYVYIDESGDLGFDLSKRHTSKYFVIAFLVTTHPGPLEKILKKLFLELKQTGKSGPGNFHAHEETDKIRTKILTSIAEKEVELYYILLDKRKDFEFKNELSNTTYFTLICKALSELFNASVSTNTFKIYLSKRETNRANNQMLIDKIQESALIANINCEILIKPHHSEKCLQLVDFVSWAIFQNYENGKTAYMEMIRNKIVKRINGKD